MQVSFIIPALNEERLLGQCLASICSLDLPSGVSGIEILVVDSQSQDQTAEIARGFGAKVVTVQPGSISRSRNTGARESRGELLAFIDADCELPREWLVRCAGHLARPEVLAAGACMAPPPPSAPWVERCWHALAYRPPAVESERVGWLMSFNLLVRREAFDRVGGFDETLVTCEDSDFGYKLAEIGQLVKDYSARAGHHGSSKTASEFFRREAWRNRGSLLLAFRHRLQAREWITFVMPPVFSACLLGGPILLLLSLAWPGLAWFGGPMLAIAALVPAVFLLTKGLHPSRPVLYLQCWIVFCLYLLARTFGMLLPFRRVAR